MEGNSRTIISNQTGLHPRLHERVTIHLNTDYQAPIRESTRELLKAVLPSLQNEFILDSCCGVGASSKILATNFPNTTILGIDKSAHRLARGGELTELFRRDNLILMRADCSDVWRFLVQHSLTPRAHYLLYPNPWPKSHHLQRRCHGSPAFKYLVQLGGQLEVRSNWDIYVKEFAEALTCANRTGTIEQIKTPLNLTTPFEQKYFNSGHLLWRLTAPL